MFPRNLAETGSSTGSSEVARERLRRIDTNGIAFQAGIPFAWKKNRVFTSPERWCSFRTIFFYLDGISEVTFDACPMWKFDDSILLPTRIFEIQRKFDRCKWLIFFPIFFFTYIHNTKQNLYLKDSFLFYYFRENINKCQNNVFVTFWRDKKRDVKFIAAFLLLCTISDFSSHYCVSYLLSLREVALVSSDIDILGRNLKMRSLWYYIIYIVYYIAHYINVRISSAILAWVFRESIRSSFQSFSLEI